MKSNALVDLCTIFTQGIQEKTHSSHKINFTSLFEPLSVFNSFFLYNQLQKPSLPFILEATQLHSHNSTVYTFLFFHLCLTFFFWFCLFFLSSLGTRNFCFAHQTILPFFCEKLCY